MDYAAIAKETTGYIYKAYNSLDHAGFNQALRALVELRVSQINGCVYCCRLHQAEARKASIGEEMVSALANWEESSLFDEKEQSALRLATILTCTPKEAKSYIAKLGALFSEREIVDLTLCVSLMNALNRMAISLH